MTNQNTLQQRLQQLRDSFDASVAEAVKKDTRRYQKYMAFRLGHELFAWPVNYIKKVAVNKKIVPIPGKIECLYGVLNYKNRVLSVVNLHRMLGIESVNTDQGGTILVTKGLVVDLAILVDGLNAVLIWADDDIKPKPISFNQGAGELIVGELYHQKEMITILNPLNIIT